MKEIKKESDWNELPQEAVFVHKKDEMLMFHKGVLIESYDKFAESGKLIKEFDFHYSIYFNGKCLGDIPKCDTTRYIYNILKHDECLTVGVPFELILGGFDKKNEVIDSHFDNKESYDIKPSATNKVYSYLGDTPYDTKTKNAVKGQLEILKQRLENKTLNPTQTKRIKDEIKECEKYLKNESNIGSENTTVKNRVNRAKDFIRKHLEDKNKDELIWFINKCIEPDTGRYFVKKKRYYK